MQNRGIKVLASDSIFLDVLFTYLINEKGVSKEECIELNHKVVDYMKTDRFSEYERLVRKSKTLKPYHIDWDYIDCNLEKKINEWNELTQEVVGEANND